MHSANRTNMGRKEGLKEGGMDHYEERNLPRIRLAEVRKHDTPDDCWMVVHGRIYDVGPILAKHPGGSQILLKYAGMDATFPFDDVGHTVESLIYDMPPGTFKGLLDPEDGPSQKQHGCDYEDPEEKDSECITMAHGQAVNSHLIWNRIYTSLLYFTIIVCASLLLYVRFSWHPELGHRSSTSSTITHHQDGASASLNPHQESLSDEDSIPAWAY